MSESVNDLEAFIEQWHDSSEKTKAAFLHLKGIVESLDAVSVEFVARQGVTYSLRPKHLEQTEKPLFALIDVIEAEPRWLSVCFYAEYITDPDQIGDFVPGGLLGEDAFCFDMEQYDEQLLQYLENRLEEAHKKAGN